MSAFKLTSPTPRLKWVQILVSFMNFAKTAKVYSQERFFCESQINKLTVPEFRSLGRILNSHPAYSEQLDNTITTSSGSNHPANMVQPSLTPYLKEYIFIKFFANFAILPNTHSCENLYLQKVPSHTKAKRVEIFACFTNLAKNRENHSCKRFFCKRQTTRLF